MQRPRIAWEQAAGAVLRIASLRFRVVVLVLILLYGPHDARPGGAAVGGYRRRWSVIAEQNRVGLCVAGARVGTGPLTVAVSGWA
jgi:hypothetical protein